MGRLWGPKQYMGTFPSRVGVHFAFPAWVSPFLAHEQEKLAIPEW